MEWGFFEGGDVTTEGRSGDDGPAGVGASSGNALPSRQKVSPPPSMDPLHHLLFDRQQRGGRPLAVAGADLDAHSVRRKLWGRRCGRGAARRLLIIGALLTTPFLVWRLIVGHWAARAAQAQARNAQTQTRVAQETARNTLFTKAIEQLGATREEKTKVTTKDANGVTISSTEENAIRPNTEVRLGAIYALEKLARDDLEMHWPIMETLYAYIRENAGKPKFPPTEILTICGSARTADRRPRSPISKSSSANSTLLRSMCRRLSP